MRDRGVTWLPGTVETTVPLFGVFFRDAARDTGVPGCPTSTAATLTGWPRPILRQGERCRHDDDKCPVPGVEEFSRQVTSGADGVSVLRAAAKTAGACPEPSSGFLARRGRLSSVGAVPRGVRDPGGGAALIPTCSPTGASSLSPPAGLGGRMMEDRHVRS